MSRDLTLGGFKGFKLRQAPSDITRKVLESRNPLDVYFAWLDAQAEKLKPKLHPRASNSQKKVIMSTPEWIQYQEELAEIQAHKADVLAYIKVNPKAKWGDL
jgi:hypothetical protein